MGNVPVKCVGFKTDEMIEVLSKFMNIHEELVGFNM